MEERYSPEEAAQHAQQHQRLHGGLPHHLRCDFVKGTGATLQRCSMASDHQGEHKYVDEPNANPV